MNIVRTCGWGVAALAVAWAVVGGGDSPITVERRGKPRQIADVDVVADAHSSEKNIWSEMPCEKILACAASVAKSPDPAARLLMVQALKRVDFYDLQDDEARLAFIEAVKSFLADPDDAVASVLLDSILYDVFMTIDHISDTRVRASTFEEIAKLSGEAFGGEWDSGFACHVVFKTFAKCDNFADRCEAMRACARVIDGLEGDARRAAEEMYLHTFDTSVEDTERFISWQQELSDVGTQVFDSEKKGAEFASIVARLTRDDDRDRFGGLEDDIESTAKVFEKPASALCYAEMKGRLRKMALARYGESDEAEAWFNNELSFYKRKLTKMEEDAREYAEKEAYAEPEPTAEEEDGQ